MMAVLAGNEEIVLRLGAAVVIGAALGLNRELHGKTAGLRTHALVGLGAAVAIMGALDLGHGSLAGDPNAVGRVVQGILTGIGFLGAGVILHEPGGHVTGLTTAATIWICAVFGIICGLGYWNIVAIVLVLTAIVLLFGRAVERLAEHIFKRQGSKAGETRAS